ncbi:hypothetical protein MIND_00785700 [Mycena indigotica]|uniref:F-box domain-containing protein n=1 Tax=Mycena indigotica TaxID=2126181 RepID=A0A8H6SM70_9AGAR|nr:uncharacterized protein MIND_00785700 [Mycena indigotica]KAF7302188.1 hypothetical protein MIND_00785700 [Mycena indigotica]
MEALWRILVNSRIGRWILGLRRFKFRIFSWLWAPINGQDTTNKVASPHPPPNYSLHGLNTDIFMELFSLLNGRDQQMLSSASRQLRSLFMPALFRRIEWAPLLKHELPPSSLWPYIRTFAVLGDRFIRTRLFDNGYESHYTHQVQVRIASQLKALTSMTNLDEVQLYEVPFGPWPQLIEVIISTPSVKRLVLASHPYSGPSPVALSTVSRLSHVSYNMHRPLKYTPSSNIAGFSGGIYHDQTCQYPADLVASEGRLARAWLNPKTLESLSMPGQFVLEALDLTVRWNAMRELHLEGVFPLGSKGAEGILDVLHAMPRLRVAHLKLENSSNDIGCREYVTQDALSKYTSHRLLPDLVHFEAPISADEHILSVLPSTLEKLLLTAYPLFDFFYFQRLVIPASALIRILSRAEFPTLTSLEISYSTKADGELSAEEQLLQIIPRKFPRLQHLMIRRDSKRDGPNEARLAEGWDPTRPFGNLLSQLFHLETFSFDADIPGTRDADALSARRGYYHASQAYVDRLVASLAEQRARPSTLRKISIHMYSGIRDTTNYPWGPWLIWDIVQVRVGGELEYQVRYRKAPKLVPYMPPHLMPTLLPVVDRTLVRAGPLPDHIMQRSTQFQFHLNGLE